MLQNLNRYWLRFLNGESSLGLLKPQTRNGQLRVAATSSMEINGGPGVFGESGLNLAGLTGRPARSLIRPSAAIQAVRIEWLKLLSDQNQTRQSILRSERGWSRAL